MHDDEAHFWLNGYVNKQNCRIWSEANPQVYVEPPLHPEKLTVWCALWAGGIIGPYFFKNDEGHNELWFQQDGATCHTARATIDLLKDTFGDRLISRFGPVNWSPRSCDLTPLDYFLWGYVKSLVYADKPQTLDHLEDNIRRVIADIRPQMLEKVIENWTSRLDYIRASRGSPMPEITFKIFSNIYLLVFQVSSPTDLLHAVIALYNTCLPDVTVQSLYRTVCAEGTKTLLLLRDTSELYENKNICLQVQLITAAVAEWYRYRTVACFVTGSSPVPLKTRRVGQRCMLNLSRAETSSRWYGVVVRREGASSGVVHVT
ncbi:DUF4817 domain-containing protein [Trichonephila clavipes]|nr:DUF4817 domain-containing protein [Trichonephila clavipes]